MCKKLPAFVFLLVIFLFLSTTPILAQDPVALTLSTFEKLDTVAPSKRVQKANEVFKTNCRRLKETVAMTLLDSLELKAKELSDLPLECAVYLLRADYYSVNNGFNNTSIHYHDQAIDFARINKMPVTTAINIHKKGLYYFTFNQQSGACRYFLQAFDQFKSIGLKNIPEISTYILEQAKFYYTLKDYATAKPLLETALQYPIKNTRVRVNVINTIGLIYRSDRQYQQAIKYFERALDTAKAKKDSAWIGITTGNIGSVYFMRGMYDKAMPYLRADYNASVKYEQFGNAAQTLLRIARISQAASQFQIAARQLDTAKTLISKNHEDALELNIELFDQKEGLFQRAGSVDSAFFYAKKFESSRDSLSRRNNVALIEGVKLKWETEKYRTQINQLKLKADTDAFQRNAVIVILFLLMIIFLLIFNRFRLDARRDQEMLMIRKRRVDEKLRTAAESLQLYTENLKQNNLLIEKFKSEIELYKVQTSDQAGAEHLERLMQAHIMTDETWDEFKKLFTKVHSGFFSKLRNKFPNLTDTDTRLLALVKLGLNNREMANMLGITLEGIKKSKQRLRKKMQLLPDTDLEQTVAGL